MMTSKLISAPAQEPLTLDEVRGYLRIDSTAFDATLLGLVQSARSRAEAYTGRVLITQTWDLLLDDLPGLIELPKAPVQSVTEIVYVGAGDVDVTMAAADYETDLSSTPARIVPADAGSWSVVLSTNQRFNLVRVRYVAGYGADPTDVDPEIRTAMLAWVTLMHENPAGIAEANAALEALLFQKRVELC